jgi:hypothetical protein
MDRHGDVQGRGTFRGAPEQLRRAGDGAIGGGGLGHREIFVEPGHVVKGVAAIFEKTLGEGAVRHMAVDGDESRNQELVVRVDSQVDRSSVARSHVDDAVLFHHDLAVVEDTVATALVADDVARCDERTHRQTGAWSLEGLRN